MLVVPHKSFIPLSKTQHRVSPRIVAWTSQLQEGGGGKRSPGPDSEVTSRGAARRNSHIGIWHGHGTSHLLTKILPSILSEMPGTVLLITHRPALIQPLLWPHSAKHQHILACTSLPYGPAMPPGPAITPKSDSVLRHCGWWGISDCLSLSTVYTL